MLSHRQSLALAERDRLELGEVASTSMQVENTPFWRDISESIITHRARRAQDAALGLVVWRRGNGSFITPQAYLTWYETQVAAEHCGNDSRRQDTTIRPGSLWPPREG